jgi:hypothetical protein
VRACHLIVMRCDVVQIATQRALVTVLASRVNAAVRPSASTSTTTTTTVLVPFASVRVPASVEAGACGCACVCVCIRNVHCDDDRCDECRRRFAGDNGQAQGL